MSKATKDLVVTGAAQIDLRRILEDRNTDRNDIINHAISLQRKLMAIQYHRDRFLEGLQACAATPDCVLFHQVQMEAEFVAHDAMTYSFLEELSALISKLHWIRTGKNLPKSFNDLLGFPGVPAGFEDIFKTAKWFPEFHARRTNSTHSFGPVITFDATQNDLSIYHNQERRFAALPGELSAKAQFECLVTGFDDMTRALCVLMLKWFHPYDILAFQALVPGGASGPEETRVWTRGVEFDATLTQGSEGMALLDAEGRSHFKVPLGRAGADPQSASEGVAGAAPANKPIEPTAAPCD
jgi:hypothetical protein